MLGFTGNYLRVACPYDPNKVNTIEEVFLSKTAPNDLFSCTSALSQ